MSAEWLPYIPLVSLLLTPIFALLGGYIGYRLGLRSQKVQILRGYITNIVKDEYPSLFAELISRSELLDNFLDNSHELKYSFPKLKDIYRNGRIGFIEKHHKDLFLKVEYFEKNLLSKFEELARLIGTFKNGRWKHWGTYLEDTLPEEVKTMSKSIAQDLIQSINQYNVISDLLNERYVEAQNKIEKYLVEKVAKCLLGKSVLYHDKISHSLIESAKPEVEKLLDIYRKLKEQNDKVVKKELLPLLQKYIANPVYLGTHNSALLFSDLLIRPRGIFKEGSISPLLIEPIDPSWLV